MPAPLPDLILHCQELLAPMGSVRSRRMFGGHGLYIDDVFIALVFGDELFLKADDTTRERFAAAGCRPFSYEADGRTLTINYWTAPEDAMESPVFMQPWARLAMEAGLRARAAKRTKPAGTRAAPRTRRKAAA